MGSKIEEQPRKNFVNGLLKTNVKAFMAGIGLWEEGMESEIPHSFQKFNNFLLIKDDYFTHPNWKAAGPALWQLISGLMGGIQNIALYGKINNDDFRTPSVKLVYGNEKCVKFLDNGILYTWRVDKVMFSRGNLTERHRVAKFDCRNQVVVDMFAGIGYFTLPYLVHAKAKLVLAFEWNPDAIFCLLENLYLNHVEQNCKVTLGNVRQTCPAGVADHVNMGLIPSCEEYWETGARALKPTGGILHVHGTVSTKPAQTNRTESLRTEDAESNDKCIKCVTALRSLNLLHASPSVIKDRRAQFALDLNSAGQSAYTILGGNGCIWKKPQFLEWGIHVAHSIAVFLVNAHNFGWRVRPVFFNRIKKYAPHVFHVVVDLHCEPLLPV